MKLGITMFATGYAIRPSELAVAAEERGFESIWLPEHTHIPASRQTPYPLGGDLPEEYWSTYDPFVALMSMAAVTERIKVATGTCLVIERDPIDVAKKVASLDQLSNGRFLFGIGGGWNREEMENHGTVFKTRWKLLRERIEAMKQIWTQKEAEYHGEFVDFDPIWSEPKPLQQPYPPIHLGVHTANGRKRVVRYCDGWIPVGPALNDLPGGIRDLHAKAEEAGRDPKTIEVSCFGAPPEEAGLAAQRDAGVDRGVFHLPPKPRDEVLPILDAYAELVPKLG